MKRRFEYGKKYKADKKDESTNDDHTMPCTRQVEMLKDEKAEKKFRYK